MREDQIGQLFELFQETQKPVNPENPIGANPHVSNNTTSWSCSDSKGHDVLLLSINKYKVDASLYDHSWQAVGEKNRWRF